MSHQDYATRVLMSSPLIINNNEKEFLLDLIEQIQDTELRKEYLQKFKSILIKEDSLEPPHKVSINKIF